MNFQERLRHIRHEYYAIMAATCQDDQASSLLDSEKVAQFLMFYDFLLLKGFSRQELSAHGISRDVASSLVALEPAPTSQAPQPGPKSPPLRGGPETPRVRRPRGTQRRNEMKAQTLYDAREEFKFCSGMDLHYFFQEEVGDMSPSGYVDLDGDRIRDFIQAHIDAMRERSPSVCLEMVREMQEAADDELTSKETRVLLKGLNLTTERVVHHCPICGKAIKVGWRPTEPHMGQLLALGGGDDGEIWVVTQKCEHLTIDGGQGNDAFEALFSQRSYVEVKTVVGRQGRGYITRRSQSGKGNWK